jgi:Diadenosine tetraphosphate (Ap4A) hydrolase and other HIT family hydrolases
MDCIFCRIISGEIPAEKVYEDESVLVFKDLESQAPLHMLLVPKQHIANAAKIDAENSAVVGHIFEIAAKVAKEQGYENYRVVTNCGEDAGQSVFHLHFHLLAGRKFHWPPG